MCLQRGIACTKSEKPSYPYRLLVYLEYIQQCSALFSSYDGIFVRIGSVDWHKSPAREVDSIIVHEEFVVCETGMLENDLALLKLKILLEFDDHIQPIPLIDYEIPDQSKVVVSGWGTETGGWQSAKILNKITLIKINLEICKKQYEYKEEIYIGDGKICTFTKYGEGICEVCKCNIL